MGTLSAASLVVMNVKSIKSLFPYRCLVLVTHSPSLPLCPLFLQWEMAVSIDRQTLTFPLYLAKTRFVEDNPG